MTCRASIRKRIVGMDCDKISTQSNVTSVTNNPLKSLCRQSPRLKAINAIYEADDATISSQLKQSCRDNSSCNSYPAEVENFKATDDLGICVTLNDMRKRCRAKKRETLNSVALNHFLLKPKEEPDLDEPLICLKLKKENKRRKFIQHSNSLSVDENTLIESGIIALESNSLAFENSVDQNVEETSIKNLSDAGNADDLVCNVKCKISESCNDICYDMEASPLINISNTVNEIKTKVIEMNLVESNRTYDVFASDMGLIPEIKAYDNPSEKLHEIVTASELKHGDETSVSIQPQDSCVNEVDLMEIDSQKCIRQSNEACCGEGIVMDSSDISCHKLSSFSDCSARTSADNLQLVSSTTNLTSDVYSKGKYDEIIYDSIKNYMNDLVSIDNCMEFRTGKKFENERGEMSAQPMHDFSNTSSYNEEVGSLDSLVFKALCGETHINNHEDKTTTIENNSSAETYDLCIPKHSETSFSSLCDLHTNNAISSTENTILYSSIQDQNLSDVEETLSKNENDTQSRVEEKLKIVEGEEFNIENEVKNSQDASEEHHPKNLLQNRKDLSPISQEKLIWVFNDNELDKTIRTPNHEKTEVMLSPEKLKKRQQRSRKASLQIFSRGNMKPQNASDSNCSCMKNSLIHTQAQKAVTFSQRQMQDIENIATKLLKEISSLKSIVKNTMDMGNVGSEAYQSSTSKFTPEEMMVAIENASNLEATTKKWLSMMSKDCNRFCKIMNLTENKGSSPVSVSKQSKKVTFADEAGGMLCHIKLFEQPPAAHIEPKDGNQAAI